MTEHIKFSGRILFLTEDTALIRQQLEARDEAATALEAELAGASARRRSAADEQHLDRRDNAGLGLFLLRRNARPVRLRRHARRRGQERRSEEWRLCGRCFGTFKRLRLVARNGAVRRESCRHSTRHRQSIEKIYGQNSQNIGLLTSTDFGLIERIRRGEEIPLAEFTKGLDPISQDIVAHGGLFNYNKARLAGKVSPPPIETAPRPMTIVEKIIARHAFVTAGQDRRRGSEAGRCVVCSCRRALLARVRDADGRVVVQAGAWVRMRAFLNRNQCLRFAIT